MEKKPERITRWGKLPSSGVWDVFGHRGKGKSALAWWLAERAHKDGRQVAAYGFTTAAKRALPKWVKHVGTLAGVLKLKPSVIVVDEAALKANARQAMSADNIEWAKMVAIARHKEHLLMFVSQHARQIDVSLVTDADLVLLKEPSLLHLRFARPELRPELEQAWQTFQSARGDRRRRTFVVNYHTGEVGFLTNELPSFWSDKLSRAFAAVELLAEEKKATTRRQKAARGAKQGKRRGKP